MELNRRGFIGILMAGLAGTLLPRPDLLLWQPQPEATAILAPSALVTLEQITREMLRRVVDELGVRVPLDEHPETRLWRTIALGERREPAVLNHQQTVTLRDVEMPHTIDRFGLDPERYLMPAADLLIAETRRHGRVRGCGVLLLPYGVEQACVVNDRESGLSVRGIHYWDMVMGDILRFDMLTAI